MAAAGIGLALVGAGIALAVLQALPRIRQVVTDEFVPRAAPKQLA